MSSRRDLNYINEQTGELQSGIGDAGKGIDDINKGLTSVQEELDGNGRHDFSEVQKLINGTSQLKQGVFSIEVAISQ